MPMVARERKARRMIGLNRLPLPVTGPEPIGGQKVRSFSVSSRWLLADEWRLDASFYADEVVRARRAVENARTEVRLLGQPEVTRRIYNLPRFKRIYTAEPSKGYPYLGASEAMSFRPQTNRWIARDKAPALVGEHFAKAGWILVTCSGGVGRCALVTKRLERYFLTHDLLRVIPVVPAGYLYAFLSSCVGQTLMGKEQYGGTITHLEPYHLRRIPVPLLPEEKQWALHQQITEAYRLRDEANDLLDEAESLLHRELGLPQFDESKVTYLGGSIGPKAFTVNASELDDRLDASFHNPVAKGAIQQLIGAKYPVVRLGACAQIFMPPTYKRVYVDSQHGLPVLSGSHLTQQRPMDLKFISTQAFDRVPVERYRIRAKWILVTGRGTTGVAHLVPSGWDGWLASHNILRVIAEEGRMDSGYVFAFLTSSYGSLQIASKRIGAVVSVLTPEDLSAVVIPNPPLRVQQSIGALVMEAFEKKEEANQVEARAIRALESAIMRAQ